MVRLEVEQLLFMGHLLQASQLPLLVVDLVLHELLNRAHVVLNDMLVSVNVRQVIDLFGLKSFLLLLRSLLFLLPLSSEGVEPLGDLPGRPRLLLATFALFGCLPLLK